MKNYRHWTHTFINFYRYEKCSVLGSVLGSGLGFLVNARFGLGSVSKFYARPFSNFWVNYMAIIYFWANYIAIIYCWGKYIAINYC